MNDKGDNMELWEDLGAFLPWVLGIVVVVWALNIGVGRAVDIVGRLMGWW